MKRINFLSILLLFISLKSFSQVDGQGLLKNMHGEPFTTKEYIDVIGTPLLFEDWCKGEIQFLNDNSLYKNIDLKYDIVRDKLLFKGENGDMLVFNRPVSMFNIFDAKKQENLTFVMINDQGGKSGFYEAIANGHVKFLKKISKKIVDKTEYASSNKIRNFETVSGYFIYKKNILVSAKKDKKSILNILSDKSAELEKYITVKKVNFKNDSEVIGLFDYYNSL